MMNSIRQFVVKGWAFLHAFWVIVGISLAMLLLIEACFRVTNAISDRRAEVRPRTLLAGDPRAASWYPEFAREYDATRFLRWKPYLYFDRFPSYRGRYVNIDSLGRRVTPQPLTPSTPAARVFFFGGSTMWGTALRDDHTIPAEASRRLQTLAGNGARIEVTNFGETGYVFTQEIILLMLELRAGSRPDVVVFYDGLNEVAATVQYGAPGFPQNEPKRVAEFTMGRALDRTGAERGLGKDFRALGLLTGQAVQQLAIVDWLKSHKPAPAPAYIAADSATRGTVRVYAENVRLVEALAEKYGFTPIYVWQPNLHASQKRLAPFEQRLLRRIESDPFHRRLQQVHRVLPPVLDSTLATVVPGRFIDDASLFRDDTMTVYTDWLGHNSEQSIPRIVDTFWPALQSAVQATVARHRGHSGSTTLSSESQRAASPHDSQSHAASP